MNQNSLHTNACKQWMNKGFRVLVKLCVCSCSVCAGWIQPQRVWPQPDASLEEQHHWEWGGRHHHRWRWVWHHRNRAVKWKTQILKNISYYCVFLSFFTFVVNFRVRLYKWTQHCCKKTKKNRHAVTFDLEWRVWMIYLSSSGKPKLHHHLTSIIFVSVTPQWQFISLWLLGYLATREMREQHLMGSFIKN